MAMFFEKPKPRGYSLIAAELDMAKGQLKDRQADLVKAEKHVTELKDTCGRLTDKRRHYTWHT